VNPSGNDDDGIGMWWCVFEGVGFRVIVVDMSRLGMKVDMGETGQVEGIKLDTTFKEEVIARLAR